MVNSQVESDLLEKYGTKIKKVEIDINKVLIINTNLRETSTHTDKKDRLFNIYKAKGYSAVEAFYKSEVRKTKIKRAIKKLIPKKAKTLCKKLLHK
jgi:hypothetical protein